MPHLQVYFYETEVAPDLKAISWWQLNLVQLLRATRLSPSGLFAGD